MKVIRAKHLGMCFGVRDAIAMAMEQSNAKPLTIFGDLVHNETVVNALKQKGIAIERDPTKISTKRVMITAHGASDQAMQGLREKGFQLIEGTCPLVHHAHQAIKRLLQENFHPIIIGKHDHVEVRGLTEDLDEFDVVLSEEDVALLQERPKLGIVAQTTQPVDRVHDLADKIRKRFPRSAVRLEDTVCQPTKQRQLAAIELAQMSDVVVVIGGPKSNNTRELVATCRRFCDQVHYVQSCQDLREEWFTGCSTVGITAGTSTPDFTVDAVENWLTALAKNITSTDLPYPSDKATRETSQTKTSSANTAMAA